MVTKNELRKQEEKLEHLLGQRRQHQDELVTAQVEMRHVGQDHTRLLAEGVLSGRRDEASVAETEKRVGELKGKVRGLEAALELERGIIAEAQTQVEQAGREWAAGRGLELVRQATENRHKLEEARTILVGISAIVLDHEPDKTASRLYIDGDGPIKEWRTIPPEWGELLCRRRT